MNNGKQFEESVLTLQICLTKEYISKRNKEGLGREGSMCLRNQCLR